MNYIIHIWIFINIYVILVVSTNLLVGLTNLISLGQAAFYGIGAYITALCLMVLNLSLIPTLLIVMLINAVLSFLLSVPAIKLKGDYFIIATLGFQLIVYTILYNWIPVTKGPYGIPGIPSPEIFGLWEIKEIYIYLAFSLVLMAIVIFVFYRLIHSPFGRVLRGLREDETTLLILGRNVKALKIWVFILSSAFIGFSSVVYATYVSYIDPTSFNLDESIFILMALIIGGTGNIRGPVIGAVFVVLLPEMFRFVGLPDNIAAPMRQIIYGLSLMMLMYFRPKGILGNFKMK